MLQLFFLSFEKIKKKKAEEDIHLLSCFFFLLDEEYCIAGALYYGKWLSVLCTMELMIAVMDTVAAVWQLRHALIVFELGYFDSGSWCDRA